MNFKLFLPLSALALLVASCQDETKGLTNGSGTISPEFTIDYSVSNPRTQSRAESTPESMPEGDTPELSGFSFRLVKDDGKFDKTFTGLGEFVGTDFPVGAYSLEATYGDIEEEGAGKPYFEGSTTFNVYDGEETQPTLVAKLANTAVTVEYTEAFINYFTAYSTEIHSSNGTNTIEMPTIDQAGTSSDWVYVKPGNVTITIDVTKQNGVNYKVEAATITDAQPGTHYHVKIDANGGEVGNATITVTFDDTTDLEPIEIDVSDDIVITPAPELTAIGFTSGTAIDILEGDAAENDLKVTILAQGGIKTVTLNIASPTPALSNLQGDVELVGATDAVKNTLTSLGVTTVGLWSGNVDKIAQIDFTNILPKLAVSGGNSTHKFTISVVDKIGRTCDAVELTVEAPKPILTISNPADLYYGDTQAEFDFTYNGKNLADKVKFKATNAMGVFGDCTIAEVTSKGGNLYRVKINIPESEDDVNLKAIYNTTESDVVTLKRLVQVVANDYDVWATKAAITLAPSRMKDKVTSITLNGTSRSETFDAVGKCTFTGLTANTTYNAVVTMDNGLTYPVSFTTEEAKGVPNGDFETLKSDAISVTDMNMGGKWTRTVLPSASEYYNYESFTVYEPDGWTTINNKTCNLSASTLNSWFVIPSTYATNLSWDGRCPGAGGLGAGNETPSTYQNLTAQSGNIAMVVRNVAWDANGTEPGVDKKTGNVNYSNYYCTNVPTIANRSAGVLNLDAEFATRPSALNGYYKYALDSQDAEEKAVVTVSILNGSTVLATGSVELGAADNYTAFNVPLTYTVTNKVATKVKIDITSSNRAEGAIKTSNHLYKYEASSYGAILTVDNLTFSY